MAPAQAIDALGPSEIARFPEYLKRTRPVVLRRLRERCRLPIFNWSVAHFEREMGARIVPVMTTETGRLSYQRTMTPMTFSDFARHLATGPGADGVRYYYKNEIEAPSFCPDDSAAPTPLAPLLRKAFVRNLWISGRGPVIALHFDPTENLDFQIRGSKRFTLHPPGVGPYYAEPLLSGKPHLSRIGQAGPRADLGRFPRFEPSKGIDVELTEGDVLYLPVYWWHQVQSLDDVNVNVNFWWIPPPRKIVANFNQALRGLVLARGRLATYGNVTQAPEDPNVRVR